MAKKQARGAGRAHAGNRNARPHQHERSHDKATPRGKKVGYTKARGDWLDGALLDHALSDTAFRALGFVSNHAGLRQDGYTYFAVATVGDAIGKGETAVWDALKNAERCGYLRIIRRGHMRLPNLYWPWWRDRPLFGSLAEFEKASRASQPRNSTVVIPGRDSTGRFTTAEIRAQQPRNSGRNNRGIPTPTPLRDSPNELLKSESSLPSLSPARAKKNSIRDLNGKNGTGRRVTIVDPDERMDRFERKLAEKVGWNMVIAARTPDHPQHDQALKLCKATAKQLGKKWPHSWRADQSYDPEAHRRAKAKLASAAQPRGRV
jgi:hypothetical protein